ncbi:hypothetical protein L6164_029901 [Bauhinia variegata]|uniref:Uncharacterized protein n=1 Tax=Bauhinia variegata TaxID=167791 RepID=A0ACB9LA30_BAUVA|nr:hypothetical protein L6164_029901 [Bauhinia variegata]
MGLNLKDIQLRLYKVIQVTIHSSLTFIKKHPLLSSAFSVLFILYIFLSYIYSFLVYLSPFLFCTAILVKVFWSSEQTQLKYVRREENKRRDHQKRNESQRFPKIPKHVEKRADAVHEKRSKYSKQHALSRRRNFRDKRLLDVASDTDEKSKALSIASNNNRISEITIERKELDSASGKEEGSSTSAGNLRLHSEPSMSDLVEAAELADKNGRFDSAGGSELDSENMEDGDDEDDEEAQEDGNKAVEWTEDDQKNLMDLGISEIERNRRLESLIARRRARNQLKMQIENGVVDVRNVDPNQLAPLFFSSQKDPIDSPKGFDGLGMPGSAPSVFSPSRNPFDIPYDPSEEKPILRGDSFDQEFTVNQLKDMGYCRHESFILGPSFPVESRHGQGDTEAYSFFFHGRKASDKLGQQKFRRLPADKGNHDIIIEQLFSKVECKVKPPNPLRNKELIKYAVVRENTKEVAEVKGEGEEINGLVTKSMIEGTASDLQVEVSDIGSVDETNTTTDGESAIYDADVDRDNVTSGSEDLGASFNSRAAHRYIDLEDIADMGFGEVEKNLKDDASSIVIEQIDEANAADVSSGETPIYGLQFGNIFGNVKKEDVVEIEEKNPLNSADVSSSPQKWLRDSSVGHPLHERHSENLEWGYPSENLTNEVKVVNDVNDSAAIKNEDSKNLQSIEDPSTSNVQQELVYEVSVNSSSSVSVLPEGMKLKTSNGELQPDAMPQSMQPFMKDSTVQSQHDGIFSNSQETADSPENSTEETNKVNDVVVNDKEDRVKLKSDANNEEKSITVVRQDADVEGPRLAEMTTVEDADEKSQELVGNEATIEPEAMPQSMQSLMKDSTVQSQHDGIFSNSQKASSLEMPDDASIPNTFREPIFDEAKVADDPSTSNISSKSVFDYVEENNISEIHQNKEASFPSAMSDDASISTTYRQPIFDEPIMADDPSTSNMLSKSVFDHAEENNISEIRGNEEAADSPENSIEKTNNFDKVNDLVVNDKEDKVKLKSDENNEEKSTTVVRQDADVESPRLAEMTKMENVHEKSRELVGNERTMEPSKMTRENDNSTTEDTKISGSVTKDETVVFHGNHVDDAEADIEAKKGVQVDFPHTKEHEEVRDPEKPEAETDSIIISTIEEVSSNSLKSKSFLKVPKGNIENESPSMRQEATPEPFITAQSTNSSSAEDIEGKHDELNKTEAIISPRSAVESNKLSKVAQTEQPEELAHPLDRSEEMRCSQNEPKELVEDDIKKKDEMASDSVTKDLLQPITTEVSNSSSAKDAEGKLNEANKKEAIKEEVEKNETMVSSRPVGEADKLSNTVHTGEPDESFQLIANDRSEGEGYVQSEPKKLDEDDKKEKLETGDINKVSLQASATSPTIFNAEANHGHAE